MTDKFLETITDPHSIITASNNYNSFPEVMELLLLKYKDDIFIFVEMIKSSESSGELLAKVRTFKGKNTRMTLLKLFRRCVSPVLDTEMTKKISKIKTDDIVRNYGETFKDIAILKEQFSNISNNVVYALCALLGEYDSRGKLGYQLTDVFFDWFEDEFESELKITGPRGAGRDVELVTFIPDFQHTYPCDFVIQDMTDEVIAVGFARYDSTRGGAQADDRTGGNSDKVWKAMDYYQTTGKKFKIIFLSDGPGLAHRDIWIEACKLDGLWDGNVRVTTLKTLQQRITLEWLNS
ncbi:hypothetical protein [Raoultella ornithinolytica]|uniref:hypothetical protein n=1 Tax=Raoultella ornithinolytica TaxID=54291 RepID=UPI0019127CDE|nr:hypothetical protein [Raoultella ornithinolytica]QQQ05834.1 hypothetical protein JJL43_22120 [Raoultella ornithinolytica]HEQ3499197.1 hypothetical protein [Raoultella ornithinolytica]